MRKIAALIAASASLLAVPSHGRELETRVGEPDFVSPPATIAQMDWLVGQWSGEGIQGAGAHESWLPPIAGTMVGTFVQETGRSPTDTGIMFTEHLYLMEENGSLVLRLKHFNADLTGWEDRDGMVSFRLLAIGPCAAYFHALTLRCVNPDAPGEGIVAAVRMKSDADDIEELVFRMRPLVTPETDGLCLEAMTTLEMNECYAAAFERAETRMNEYLGAAHERIRGEDSLTLMLRSTQEGFLAYRGGECGGVHEQFANGSIRTVMYLTCAIELTDVRARTIWQNWLTYADSTPPLLPEPKPTM